MIPTLSFLNKNTAFIFFFALLSYSSGIKAENKNPEWKVLSQKNGITTWKKDVPNSSLFAFKGKTISPGNIARLINGFLDTKEHKKWVDMYNGAKTLKINNGYDRVFWHRIKLPGIIDLAVQERDFVLDVKVEVGKENKTFKGHLKSIKLKNTPPKKCCVRALIKYCSFSFRQLPENKGVEMEVEAFVDPKGRVPGWIVYFVQKNWARNTIENLIKLAKDKNVPLHPDFKSWQETEKKVP